MTPPRVTIRCHYRNGCADWETTCTCGDHLTAGDWEACIEHALGHLAYKHPRSKETNP